jgi:hypothetical protein
MSDIYTQEEGRGVGGEGGGGKYLWSGSAERGLISISSVLLC